MSRTVSATLFSVQLALGAMAGADQRDPMAAGKQVFKGHCVECHGDTGAGDGEKARRLGFVARDFKRGAFKCRCTESGELPTDEDLARTIGRGLPGTPMPEFASVLKPEEIAAAVAYVKTFSPRFATAVAPSCVVVPAPPPLGGEAVAEGEQVFRLMQCWKCHGVQGGGDGVDAAGLKDDWGLKLKPGRFPAGKWKCGGGPGDLYRTLVTGLNGSPMPSFREAFLFSRETSGVLPAVRTAFGEEAAAALSAYLERQPTTEALAAMPEAEKASLGERRAWSLVGYLRSLVRE